MLKLIILIILSDSILAQEEKLAIFYLNGVQNEFDDAKDSLDKAMENIKEGINSSDKLKEKIKSNEVVPDIAYNQSEGLFDFYETIAQKIQELIPSISQKDTYKILSTFIFKNVILNIGNKYDEELIKELREFSAEAIARYASTAQSKALTDVTDTIRKGLEDKSTLVVSHSQGNLFANDVTKNLKNLLPDRMKFYANFQVGSAAANLEADKGDYITASQDRIIVTLLRDLLNFPILIPNIDLSNHLFLIFLLITGSKISTLLNLYLER